VANELAYKAVKLIPVTLRSDARNTVNENPVKSRNFVRSVRPTEDTFALPVDGDVDADADADADASAVISSSLSLAKYADEDEDDTIADNTLLEASKEGDDVDEDANFGCCVGSFRTDIKYCCCCCCCCCRKADE